MELNNDQAGDHAGSLFFLQGNLGSGKTVLGLEIGRILYNRRMQMSTSYCKTVNLTYCAPKERASQLLKTIGDKQFKIESQDNIFKSIEHLFLTNNLGEYSHTDKANSTLNSLSSALSKTGQWHVLVVDELSHHDDWRDMKRHVNIDIVYLNKPSNRSKVTPPATKGSIRAHTLKKTYRQGEDSFKAFKYMLTHTDFGGDLSWAEDIVLDDEGRCPDGQKTVWVECEEGVKQVEVLKAIKELLDNERKEIVTIDQTNTNEKVTVMYAIKDIIADMFCTNHDWAYVYDNTVYGSESEVCYNFCSSYLLLSIHRWWST